jgi:hypothetical protein
MSATARMLASFQRSRRQDGFTVLEVLVASIVLLVGVLSTFSAMEASSKLSLVSERQTSVAHRAQQELERVEGLPYTKIAMTATPTAPNNCPTPLQAAYPTSPDCFVSGSSFLYDRNNLSSSEPLAVDATNGTLAPNGSGTGCTDGCTGTWTDGRFSGEIFTFVTWTNDPNCSAGSICPSTRDYKRITVVVTLSNATHPSVPVLVSSLIADPSAAPTGAPANSAQNPLQSPTTQCGGSNCNQELNGSPLTEYLTDSPYTGGYQPPTTNNPVHDTLSKFTCGLLQCPPAPDQIITSLPTGTPQCFSTDIGCVPTSGGLELPPIVSGGSGSCGSTPTNNQQAHSWVGPATPVGTTTNLTGGGDMTAYLQSANGVSATVTVCVAVYIVPGGVLGNLLGNLLQTKVGATASVTASVDASAPTPVSFTFNLGQTAQLTGTIANQPRIEIVAWIGASTQSNIALQYDSANYSSQVTLIQQ